jgi:hypothetical protein
MRIFIVILLVLGALVGAGILSAYNYLTSGEKWGKEVSFPYHIHKR